MLNFTYTLREPVDGAWGSLQDDGTWNGMVRHLQDHDADIGKRITIVFINTLLCKQGKLGGIRFAGTS